MEEQSVVSSSPQQLNLESLTSLTEELADILRSSNDSPESSIESERLVRDYVVDLERKVNQYTLQSRDFSSLGPEELDAYLRAANEELNLVLASKSLMYEEIQALTRTFVQDSTNLENELEGLSCSLKFINSQGLEKLEMGAYIECSTSLEGHERLTNAHEHEDYCFEVLELDEKIEKNKVSLSSLKELHNGLEWVKALDQVDDVFTSVKVIEFEGNRVRLSMKTFIPPLEGLFYQHKLELASDFSALDHELLIEFSDGTMDLKNVEIFPDDIVIDEIIDAVKSSRKLLCYSSIGETRPSLDWLVRAVQSQIILSYRNRSRMKDGTKSR